MQKSIKHLIIGFVFGIALMLMINLFNSPVGDSNSTDSNSDFPKQKKPLYWVAPMDANYRRDKPGQSPMGMDLVPYYGDDQAGNTEGPGTIRINPDVVNNLGVRTAKVQRKPLHFEINTVGYVAYNEDKLVHIHSRIDGWIEKLYVKAEGDKVKEGQALYSMYSPTLVNAQQELLLALKRNNNDLVNAAKNRLKSLQLAESVINKIIKTGNIQEHITFYAPQSGYIDMLKIREGFYVKPAMTLISIGDTRKIWVEAEVIESQISHISQDLPITMQTDAIPTRSWQGKIDYVYPILDAKKRTLKVRIIFDNIDNVLKPNMFARIKIHHNEKEKLLLVPSEAVIRSGKTNRVVLAIGEGQFKSIEVQTGRKGDDYYEILSGIEEGDEVVISAQFLLDSESSKTSDFKRMNHFEEEMNIHDDEVLSATVKGTILSLKKQHGMININRQAIEKWDREAAIVDFITGEGVDISPLDVGDEVFFTFIIVDGNFVITEIDKLSSI